VESLRNLVRQKDSDISQLQTDLAEKRRMVRFGATVAPPRQRGTYADPALAAQVTVESEALRARVGELEHVVKEKAASTGERDAKLAELER
jgi:hypothetical protein